MNLHAYIRFEQHSVVFVKVLVGFRVTLTASQKSPGLEGSFHQLLTFYNVQGVFKYCQNLSPILSEMTGFFGQKDGYINMSSFSTF